MKVDRVWRRVNRSNPCPICAKKDYCSRSGDMVLCMRCESTRPSGCRLGGWIHIIGDATPQMAPKPKMISSPPTIIDWDGIAEEKYGHKKAKGCRRILARSLGVSEVALEALGVGYGQSESGEYSSWPERSVNGHVSGIVIRFFDGRKRMITGSRHGLYFSPREFGRDKYGPIFMPEGGSDVAAIIGLGLNVVGRPSNTGCISELIEFLKPLKNHKHMIVLGERDRRAIDNHLGCQGCMNCWPGLAGARLTAGRLSAALGREIAWAMPDSKDAREWINLNDPSSHDFLNAAFKWSSK